MSRAAKAKGSTAPASAKRKASKRNPAQFPPVQVPPELASLPESMARAALGFAAAYGCGIERARELATLALEDERLRWVEGELDSRLLVDHRGVLLWFQDMTNIDCRQRREARG